MPLIDKQMSGHSLAKNRRENMQKINLSRNPNNKKVSFNA